MVDKESPFYKPKHFTFLFVKRIFDLIFSLIGVILLIPLILIIKIAYICNGDTGSIFYIQERIGYHGKLFPLLKFRTMVPNAEEKLMQLLEKDPKIKKEYEANHKLEKDPRITKAGRILRRCSIDEFPQFINVFLGQMTIVGNRPYLPREKKDMGKSFKTIVSVKPGITGYWQSRGRNDVSFAERLKYETYYVENQTLALDVKIICRTVLSMIGTTGK